MGLRPGPCIHKRYRGAGFKPAPFCVECRAGVYALIKHAHKAVSLIILLLGLALVFRSLLANGTIVLSTHIVAGIAFIIYGAVRFYYLRGVG